MRRRTQKISPAVAFATAAFFILFRSTGVSAQPLGPELTVVLINYSEASDAVVTQARRETSRIFSQSGIRLTWTHCPAVPKPDSAFACQGEPTPGQIRVRILDRQLNNAFQDSVFGFAIAPVFASVYYESALRLAQTSSNSESDVSTILGCLIAHEIGHLLLGHNHHTVNGIMQARWEIKQIQQLTMGALAFTPEQSKLMLVNAHLRTSAAGP